MTQLYPEDGFPRIRTRKPRPLRTVATKTRKPRPLRTVATKTRAAKPEPLSEGPPRLGELLICLFTRLDRQAERLGDFEEKFRNLWLPRFGPRIARIMYIFQVVRTAIAFSSVAMVAALVDRIVGVFRG
jgi:hypothetical protein